MATKKNKKSTPKSSSSAEKTKPEKKSYFNFYNIALAVVLLTVTLLRIRLLGVPLERDEGEYAYMGNLILHGGVPYLDAYNMKLPGTYFMYSIIIFLFGYTPTGIHTGLMLISLITIFLLYLSLKKLFTPGIALVTATVYALISPSLAILGFAAHATHFINLFFALGLFFFSRFCENKKWISAAVTGLMFGLAFLMKQQAAVLMVLGGLLIIVTEILTKSVQWKRLIANTVSFCIAAVIPYLLVLLVMYMTGAFQKFWFWTVEYAGDYASSYTSWEGVKVLFNHSFDKLFEDYPVIWLLAFAGFITTWLSKLNLFQKLFVTLFGVFCFAAVTPGFYFREHYFVLAIPAVGLLSSVTLDYLCSFLSKDKNAVFVQVCPFIVVAVMGLYNIGKTQHAYYFDDDMNLINKKAYGYNPFVEAVEIGKFIKSNSADSDKIGILGSEPEIFVYANRRSATGYMYVYALMEPHKYNVQMQNEMVSELEKAKPEYMIYCNINTSWLSRPTSPDTLLNWANRYLPANYYLAGMVDIPSDGEQSQYYWGDAANRKPQYPNYIHILRRKRS